MISLNVKDYCEGCPDFEPETNMDKKLCANGCGQTLMCANTIISCRHLERCQHIMKYLEDRLNKALKGERYEN